MFNGKIHYKWSFSIAMLNYQRVTFMAPFYDQMISDLRRQHGKRRFPQYALSLGAQAGQRKVASARVEPLGQVNQKILLGFKKGSKLN